MIRFLLLQIPLVMMSPLLLTPVGHIKKCYPPDGDGRAARLEGFIAELKADRKKAATSYFFQSCTLCGGVVRECR